jgi:hypothetical protein
VGVEGTAAQFLVSGLPKTEDEGPERATEVGLDDLQVRGWGSATASRSGRERLNRMGWANMVEGEDRTVHDSAVGGTAEVIGRDVRTGSGPTCAVLLSEVVDDEKGGADGASDGSQGAKGLAGGGEAEFGAGDGGGIGDRHGRKGDKLIFSAFVFRSEWQREWKVI